MKEFKASVLGAYERGERSISLPRLNRLAGFYNVPIAQLLPLDEHDDPVIDLTDRLRKIEHAPLKIDLTRVETLRGAEGDMLNRYLNMIQVQRQDFNGRVLTIRRDDLRAIACILGVSVDTVGVRLEELGLAFQPQLR